MLYHARIDVLPQREHQRIGLQRLDLAGGLWPPVFVDLHDLDLKGGAIDFANRAQPVDLDALGFRLDRLEFMSGHVLAIAAIDDHRLFGAQALGGARSIHCGVAAAVDRHAAAELRGLALFHRGQVGNGVQYAAGVSGRNVDVLADMRADGHEDSVEAALVLGVHHVLDLAVQHDCDPDLLDAGDFGIEYVPRHAVGRNAKPHHAARHRPGLADFDRVPHQRQMPGGRQPRWPRAHDQDLLAARCRLDLRHPAVLDGQVAEEALDRVDADSVVDLAPVAGRFARVVADPPMDRRHRIVPDQDSPGRLEIPGLRLVQPALNVLSGWTGVVAGRDRVHVNRMLKRHRAGAGLFPQVRGQRDI